MNNEKKLAKIWLQYTVADNILSQYPNIHPTDIEFAAMVYYPIAKIEVVAYEKTEEDFDSVQLIMLKFMAEEIDDNAIAELTGVNSSYVRKMREYLTKIGMLDDKNGRLTEMGAESIAKGSL